MKYSKPFCFAPASVLAGVLLLARAAGAQPHSMVVYLPEAPIESMGQLADGVTQLAGYIQSAVPELALDVKAFRKSEDASAFVVSRGAGVALVLCDPAFVLDLPAGFEVRHRFVREGRQSARRVVVVKAGGGLASLSDLKGRSLTVSIPRGPGGAQYLTRAVFRGEVEPGSWFGSIVHETDDFTSVAGVLYDRTDAALVSADNPLVQKHLGTELSEVYSSSPLSLSVLAVHRDALSQQQLGALDAALASLAGAEAGAPILSVLKIDGLGRVGSPASFASDLMGELSVGRELEIALPRVSPAGAEGLPPLGPGAVPFAVGVELAEVPIPRELVDTVLAGDGDSEKRAGREP